MSVYDWPSGRAFQPVSATWSLRVNTIANVSPLNGAMQAVTLPGSRWAVSLAFPDQRWDERRELEAFLLKLDGMVHRVRYSDSSRPLPVALRGSPLASGAAAQFANTISLDGSISSGGAGLPTLAPGDWLGLPIGGGALQLVQVVNTVSGASALPGVEFRPMLRGAVADNAVITIAAPAAQFVLADASGLQFTRSPGRTCPPLTVDLVEVFG